MSLPTTDSFNKICTVLAGMIQDNSSSKAHLIAAFEAPTAPSS
jgi:hypothetical protein